jgi:bla regulator protein blaR1
LRFLLSVVFGLTAITAAAQMSDTFEVASIKLGDPMNPGTSFRLRPGGSVEIDGASLKSLIEYAYDLRDFQLSGANGWMNSERYTILAKGTLAEGPVDYRSMNDAQRRAVGALIRKRMQKLLAERFQLVVHTETKQLPMYALVVAKGGHKLTPNPSPDGSPQSSSTGRAMFKAKRVSLEQIAQTLAGITGHPVRNETALEGYYDLDMKWTPDAAPAAPDAADVLPAQVGPTLFTALQEQLGLKLEAKRGPVETLVIDRAERPSEN